MERPTGLREFRPPLVKSKVPGILAVILVFVLVVPLGFTFSLLSGSLAATYEITSESLLVTTGSILDGKKIVRLSDITTKRAVDLGWGRRSMGTSLPGYCAGRWTYGSVGTVWQATNCNRFGVLLTVTGEERPIFLTPPDPEAFLKYLESSTPMKVELDRPVSTGISLILGIVFLFVGVTVVALVALLLRGPRRLKYEIGGGRLYVQTMFSKKDWATSSLRVRTHVPEGAWRLAGTAVNGYYTGIYRMDGKNTKVYATTLASGVLIEGPARIFVTPEQRDEFLDALEAAGATIESRRST
ncbi:MAG: hypothetical protein HY791_30880 [Deltaproteobacteria bacterium]|nr:hypothetical protein [Deltaproteobacteria bacterium]